MARQPALIFDFGNVVVQFDFHRMGHALGTHLGMTGPDFMTRARERGFTDLLKQYESGGLTSPAFEKKLLDMMELNVPSDVFLSAWNDIFWINTPVARLIADLKQRGYTLVLGSNTNDMHATFYRQQFSEALTPFDTLVLSHEVGHVKPSSEFYLACARAAGAEPSGCVFIDDMAENVAGAIAAGLRGVQFREIKQLLDDLKDQGVETPELASLLSEA